MAKTWNQNQKRFDLTILTYNQPKRNIAFDKYALEGQQLNSSFDFLSQKVIPELLLRSVLEDGQSHAEESLDWFSFQPKLKISLEEDGVVKIHTRTSFDDFLKSTQRNLFQDDSKSEAVSAFYGTIGELNVISSSQLGNEIIVCPIATCAEVIHPFTKEKISFMNTYYARDFYYFESNPPIIKQLLVNDYDVGIGSGIRNYYFLADLLLKNGFPLGGMWEQNYFVTPLRNQKKICHLLFASSFKGNECFNLNDETYQKEIAENSNFDYLKKVNNLTSDAPLSRVILNDAITREYLYSTLFHVDKKNLGKWSMYRITFNFSEILKFKHPKSELLVN